VSGPATVTDAISAGMRAAFSIKRFLEGDESSPAVENQVEAIEIPSVPPADEEIAEKPRIRAPRIRTAGTFDEVIKNYEPAVATEEAGRCLRCDLEAD